MYKCTTRYEPIGQDKIGVLVTNLGTPDAPTKSGLKIYLKEFLSDTRVVEPPPARWIWKMILNFIILNFRPRLSAKSYQSVWGAFGSGSPLFDISKQQEESLQIQFDKIHPGKYQVELGMRYGNPSIKSALRILEKAECDKIIVLPLYPQYASATTGSTFDAVADEIKTWRRVPEMRFVNHYFNDERYISALANSVKDFQKKSEKPDLLLMSYHGIPRRYFNNGDSYPCHCCQTTYLLAKKLEMEPDTYKMTYQSRFGREEWMKDYTDETLKGLPGKGVKNIQVICPGFSADCLETIEEIEEENKEYFMQAGGEKYQYIPALNNRQDHIDCLYGIVEDKTQDWLKQ
jgi:ferrochelatase